jgi:SNF family Na+-dependent transporter
MKKGIAKVSNIFVPLFIVVLFGISCFIFIKNSTEDRIINFNLEKIKNITV